MRVATAKLALRNHGLLSRGTVVEHAPRPRLLHRSLLVLIGAVVGALLWATYVYLMLHGSGWLLYVAYAGIGAFCGAALVAIPRLMWLFIRKQAYRVLLKQWADRTQVFTLAARRTMESEPETPESADRCNNLAVADFLQGNYTSAAAGFQRAASQGSEQASRNLLAALTEAGDWAQVNALLQPEAGDGAVIHSTSLARISALSPEIAILRRIWVLPQSREQPPVFNNLGVQAMRLGRLPRARHAFELAIGQRASYLPAHVNLGALSYRQDDITQAVSETASAIALGSNDAAVFSNLGAFVAVGGDMRQAEKWLLRARKIEPLSAPAGINLGNAYVLDGRPEEALGAYREAIHAEQHVAEARYGMALAHIARSNYPLALEDLQLAAEAKPDDPDIVNNTGCVHFHLGHTAAAYELFKRAAELSPTAASSRNLIRAELAAGRVSDADVLLQATLDEGEELELERGLVHLLTAAKGEPQTDEERRVHEHHLNTAAAGFRKVIASGRGPIAEATFNLALTQYMASEYKPAAETLGSALRKAPDDGEMQYVTGLSYALAGMREQEQHPSADSTLAPPARELIARGRPYLAKAMQTSALREIASYNTGLAHYMLGEFQNTIDIVRRIARQDSPPHVLNLIALAQARLAQRMQLTEQTAVLVSETRKREIHARVRALLGAAIHYFRQSLRTAPAASLTHANLGLALMLRNQEGDLEAALQHWQLMYEHGNARTRHVYEAFLQVVSPEGARGLRFQDMGLAFLPLDVQEWIRLLPPALAGPKYVVQEMMDLPEWQLEASHPLLRKAIAFRQRVDRVRRKLQHIGM